jgi:DNA-binding beta-propeller fold protein YncE
MKSARLLLAVGTLVTISTGQWLGEKLSLRDTLRIPVGYQSLAYNRRNHKVYLSGNKSDSILVIDADRCRATEWITVGRGVQAMCYNPTENKLYCACANADTVAVLDGTSHQMLAKVGVDSGPYVLCFDSIRNKLYVGNQPGASVSVIDCRADTLVGTIDYSRAGTHGPDLMCAAPSAALVCCADSRDSCVVVIDCRADTIAAVTRVGPRPNALCFSPASNRIYCACSKESRRRVYGIDARTDSVVWSLAVRSPVPLCCDPTGRRLFVPDFDTLFVMDCSADTTIARVKLDDDDVMSFVGYSAMDDRVYVVGMGGG